MARLAEFGGRRSAIEEVLGLSRLTLQRAMKKRRTSGKANFHTPRTAHGLSAISDQQKPQVETLLATGRSVHAVALQVGIIPQTLYGDIAKGNIPHTGRTRNGSSASGSVGSQSTEEGLPLVGKTDEKDLGEQATDTAVAPIEAGSAVSATTEGAVQPVERITREQRDREAA